MLSFCLPKWRVAIGIAIDDYTNLLGTVKGIFGKVISFQRKYVQMAGGDTQEIYPEWDEETKKAWATITEAAQNTGAKAQEEVEAAWAVIEKWMEETGETMREGTKSISDAIGSASGVKDAAGFGRADRSERSEDRKINEITSARNEQRLLRHQRSALEQNLCHLTENTASCGCTHGKRAVKTSRTVVSFPKRAAHSWRKSPESGCGCPGRLYCLLERRGYSTQTI